MTLKFEVEIDEYNDNFLDMFYFRHREFHRINAAAVIYSDSTEHWYQYGQLHRIDGPAVIYEDGIRYWYKHGEQYDP
jgi:hypothetical protein